MHILCASLPQKWMECLTQKPLVKHIHLQCEMTVISHTHFRQVSTPIFFSQKNPLFFDSYPSSDHLIREHDHLQFLQLTFFGYTKTCTCLRCEQGFKNEKLVTTKFSNFLQTLTLFFCHSANRTLVWQVRSDKINGKHPHRELTVIKLILYLQV